MLKKENMIPGSKIKVRPVIKDGLPPVLKDYKTAITADILTEIEVMPIGSTLGWTHYKANVVSGTILEVVKGPKKISGANVATVRLSNGQEGYVYWCTLRASCDHI